MSTKRLDIWGLPIDDDPEPETAPVVAPAEDSNAASSEGESSVDSSAPVAAAAQADAPSAHEGWPNYAPAAAPEVDAEPVAEPVSAAPVFAAVEPVPPVQQIEQPAIESQAAEPAETVAPPPIASAPVVESVPAFEHVIEPVIEPEPVAAAENAPAVDAPLASEMATVAVPTSLSEAAEVADMTAASTVTAADLAPEVVSEAAATVVVPSEVAPSGVATSTDGETVDIAPVVVAAGVANAESDPEHNLGAAALGAAVAAATAAAITTPAAAEVESKPAPAWIPPNRKKKKSQAMLAGAAATDAASSNDLAKTAAATAVAATILTDSPVAPQAVGGIVTPSAEVGMSLPVIPPANPPTIPLANQPASLAAGGMQAYAPPSTSSSTSPGTTANSDDFWGVPPSAATTPAGLPASLPASNSSVNLAAGQQSSANLPLSVDARSAAALGASGTPAPASRNFLNRAPNMSTPSGTSAALAAVGGLVPSTFVPLESRAATLAAASVLRSLAKPPSEGRIEVMNPEGWKRDYPLRRSILYVGSAAGSDILLPMGDVAPRHLQFVPSTANRVGYRLINLGSTPVAVRGATSPEPRVAGPRASLELADGDRVELGGYGLIFHSGEMVSGLIQVRLEVPNARLSFDKPLDGALYIRNGGDRAGVQFMVEVQGIDGRFVQIEPGPVLFPDVEKRVAFRLTHPRTSAPAAGDQPINFVVSAPEGYPGETAVASQVISIAPFFAHKVRLIAIEPDLSGFSLSSGY